MNPLLCRPDAVSGLAAVDPAPLHAKLRGLLRNASMSRLGVLADMPQVALLELDAGFRPGRILASHLVVILISGDAMRVTFKVHFNAAGLRRLAFRIFGGVSPDQVSERQVIDYFKEYGNLVAGYVVAQMQKVNVELGISLPLCTRGFYEVFADYSERRDAIVNFSDFWKLGAGSHQVHCSALFEIVDARQLAGVADIDVDQPSDEDGEMDFL